jgi:hypothetical protein
LALKKVSADDIVGFTDAPTTSESEQLTQLGTQMFGLDKAITELEAQLESKKGERLELAMHTLPAFMQKIGQDRVGLNEFQVDVVLEPYYHANIAADWTPEQREAAFAYLEEGGNGDLIKTTVSIAFPRRMLAAARWLTGAITTLFHYMNEAKVPGTPDALPEPTVDMGVTWNTLTAFVREQLENGNPIDVEVLGATVGWIAKVKPRKESKKGKK